MKSFVYRLFSEEQVIELIKLQKEITFDYLERLEVDTFASPFDDELIELIKTFLKQNEIECDSTLIKCISKEIYHESI